MGKAKSDPIEEILAQLRESGVQDDSLLNEIKRGFMREADYTQAKQQLAYLAGQQQANGNGNGSAAPAKSRFETVLEEMSGGSEDVRGAIEFMKPLFDAMREDFTSQQEQTVQPLLQHVSHAKDVEALERRLQTELIPHFGPGIKEHWEELKPQMITAMQRETVDPIGFTYRVLKDDAHELVGARMNEQKQQHSAGTGEGFARVTDRRPPFGGSAGENGSAGSQASQPGTVSPGDGGGKTPPPPTLADQAGQYLDILSKVRSVPGH